MKANKNDWSDYALSHKELKGYNFLRLSGHPIYRWQLYALGYRNTSDLKFNRTKFQAVNRPLPVYDAQ